MKRAIVVFVVIFLGFSVFLDISAFGDSLNRESTSEGTEEPAVEGNSYFGQFVNSCGQTATSCMAFDRQGFIAFDQNYGAGPIGFVGTYEERKFGQNSLWFANLIDLSPNGSFFLVGLAAGNKSTLMILVNIDEKCIGTDTPMLAFGNLSRVSCTPVPPGVTEEEGLIGGADTK